MLSRNTSWRYQKFFVRILSVPTCTYTSPTDTKNLRVQNFFSSYVSEYMENNNNNTMFSPLWTTEVEASNTQLFRYIQIFRYPELIVHVVNG